MLLTAALIVRDEAGVLGDCLASIRHIVDEIVVVDTGSVDDSPAIAARYGARVLHHPWSDDFAQARNIGLDAAAGRWILYVDADELLAPTDRQTVERLLSDADEVAFRVLLQPDQRSTPYLEYRLWRHDPRIRFVGRIHEKVTPSISAIARLDGRSISDCELLLTHIGYEGNQSHKHERNLPLLRAELSERPNNLFNRHHLARVLQGLERTSEAEAVLVDAVDLARRRPSDPVGVLVFTNLIRMRRDQGEDITGLLIEARERYPANKLLWWLEAGWHLSNQRYEDALERLDALLAVDLATLPAEGPGYDARIFGESAHEARGACLFRLGRYGEAADAFRAALRTNPGNLAYRSKWIVARARADGGMAARPSTNGQPGDLFAQYYEPGSWGPGSGFGSSAAATSVYRSAVERLLEAGDVGSVVDAGCGDWQFSRLINWNGVSYLGIDVVPDVIARNRERFALPGIAFQCSDLHADPPPPADLLLCKDVLQHWPVSWIQEFLLVVQAHYGYVLLTNDDESTYPSAPRNSDIGVGNWRPLDLEAPPFRLRAAWHLDYDLGHCKKRILLLVPRSARSRREAAERLRSSFQSRASICGPADSRR